jgi:hypothetical protein
MKIGSSFALSAALLAAYSPCLRARAQSVQSSPPTAQTKPRDAAQKAEKEEARRKAQAVEILKGVVEHSGNVEEIEARASIASDALDLLWKHDETYARANFLKQFDALASQPPSSDADGVKRGVRIKSAINLLLKALAKHDPATAAKLMERYRQLAETASKDDEDAKVSQRDRLALARASLDLDPSQSAALAAKVLESGLPSSLPEYLYDLERHDAATADALYRETIAALARGAYNTTQATILSTAVFREQQPLYPVANPEAQGSTAFGMMLVNNSVAPPSAEVSPALARAYLAAAGAFLSAQAVALEQGDAPDAAQAGYCYFLVKKLKAYADKLSLNADHSWDALDAKFEILARRARLSGDTLGGLSMFARRIATESHAIEFSDGSHEFAEAEKTQDQTRRDELLASGVHELIANERLAEAEQRIADIKDANVRERLTDYLYFSEAEAAIKKLDWDAVTDRINRVGDAQMRSYLLLDAGRAALGVRRKDAALEYLRAEMSAIPKIDEPDERAMMLVAASGTLYTVDPQWGAQVLTDAVKAINNASAYHGGGYGVTIDSPKYKLWFPLADSDLSRAFERAAKIDWANALVAARGINSKEIQSKALVAACRAVL